MKTLSYEEFKHMKQAVMELSWVWRRYQQNEPDGWYEFKYQHVVRDFLKVDGEEKLLSQANHKRLTRRVKLPIGTYLTLKELADISLELQDVLEHPPYGSIMVEKDKKDFRSSGQVKK